jgi:hypothetical protein
VLWLCLGTLRQERAGAVAVPWHIKAREGRCCDCALALKDAEGELPYLPRRIEATGDMRSDSHGT